MSRKAYTYSAALASLLFAAALSGCGSDNKEGGISPADVPKVSEAACAQCHGSAVSSVTGTSIYAAYNASAHFTKGVGCQDCHGGGAQHNGVGPLPYPKPDEAGRCDTCHDTLFFTNSGAPQHKVAVSVATAALPGRVSALYVTAESKCSNCHDPHQANVGGKLTAWKDSGHGNANADPWTHYNFGSKNDPFSPGSSRAECARCHTATGFKSFLTNPSAGGWAFKDSGSAVEVLRCDACHTSYNFNLRSGVTNGASGAFYKYSTNVPSGSVPSFKLADAGASNICVNCHAGLQSGTFISRAATFSQLSSSSFGTFNSHYMAAAGTLYGIIGYEGFQTSHTPYASGGFQHNLIGLNGIGGVTDGVGPCVGCHMGSTGTSDHSLQNYGNCNTCHQGSLTFGVTIRSTADSKAAYDTGLNAIVTQLAARGIYFDGTTYPYFFTDPVVRTSAKGTINWKKIAAAIGDKKTATKRGQRLVGAAFNLNVLKREPGGWAHNNQYVMRLIFDTLNYLESGTNNDTNGTLTGTLTGVNADGTTGIPLATLQSIFGVTVDGVTPVPRP